MRTAGSKNGVHGANIDKLTFENLCAIFCTEQEICGVLGYSHDTINRWCKDTYNLTFEEAWKMKSASGKVSIRRYQFQQAKTNPTMAIWLGKQILGQSDKAEAEVPDKIEVINDVKD